MTVTGDGIRKATDVTPEWLTSVLSRSGGLPAGVSVESVSSQPVGTGQMADTLRLTLTYEPSGAGPPSLIAKLASEDDTSRSTGLMTRAYEIEVSIYDQVADRIGTRMPRGYFGWHDPDTGWFVLLLEDVTDGEQGEQLAGCVPEVAAAALDELAALHGPAWESEVLRALPWLNRSTPESNRFLVAMVTGLFPGFVDRYGERLEPAHLAVCERFVAGLGPWLEALSGPRTATHGDFRLDNLLFRPADPRPWVVDWQTAAWGLAASDVSYFLGGSLSVADRRAHEHQLLASYHRALVRQGVIGYGLAQLEDDYRLTCFGGLLMGIAASMLVKRTDRGDAMFVNSVHHHAQQAIDIDAEAMLRGRAHA
ncbi:MAG TPA: aminoglycoside phosphotransferase family protein [Acidimicrobiales bacterium]|jgi:hypothetical protein|nr:aminoglycoside phosphotransferase family protein [Acidimicrobiales bacterium]